MKQFLNKLSGAITTYITNNLKVFKHKTDRQMRHYIENMYHKNIFFYCKSLSSDECSTHHISDKIYNLIAVYVKLNLNLFIYYHPEKNHYQCLIKTDNVNNGVYCDLYACLGYIFETD
jgi:hypothetical protein